MPNEALVGHWPSLLERDDVTCSYWARPTEALNQNSDWVLWGAAGVLCDPYERVNVWSHGLPAILFWVLGCVLQQQQGVGEQAGRPKTARKQDATCAGSQS